MSRTQKATQIFSILQNEQAKQISQHFSLNAPFVCVWKIQIEIGPQLKIHNIQCIRSYVYVSVTTYSKLWMQNQLNAICASHKIRLYRRVSRSQIMASHLFLPKVTGPSTHSPTCYIFNRTALHIWRCDN